MKPGVHIGAAVIVTLWALTAGAQPAQPAPATEAAPAAQPAAIPAAQAAGTPAPRPTEPPTADAAAAPEAQAAPLPEPMPVPEPSPLPEAEPEDTEAEAFPPKLSVGKEGVFQPGILLQGWLLAGDANPSNFGPGDETKVTARLRRAEFSAKGSIIADLVDYKLMIDPSKVLEAQNATVPVDNQTPAPADPDDESMVETVTVRQPSGSISMLQDFVITFKSQYADASFGQFKVPVSWEGSNSSSKLLFAERAAVARQFGDKRDIGLQVAKKFDYFGYTAGVWNGTGQNTLDNNNAKDLALRLEGYPIDGLLVAAVIYGSVGGRDGQSEKARYEGDVRYESGPLLVQAEYIRGHDVSAGGSEVDAHGFYLALAYTLLDKFQPALRVGYLDPDVDQNLDPTASGGRDELWHIDAGVNYYLLDQQARLLLDFFHFAYDDADANNELVLGAQLSF